MAEWWPVGRGTAGLPVLLWETCSETATGNAVLSRERLKDASEAPGPREQTPSEDWVNVETTFSKAWGQRGPGVTPGRGVTPGPGVTLAHGGTQDSKGELRQRRPETPFPGW